MIARLADFQKVLLHPQEASAQLGRDHLVVRLNGAIGAMKSEPSSVGGGDIAILDRQALLRERRRDIAEPELRVPRGAGWPDETVWMRFGCAVTFAGMGHYLV